MTLQVVWDIEKRDIQLKVSIYKKPTNVKSSFTKRASCRTRPARQWTKEEIERRNSNAIQRL